MSLGIPLEDVDRLPWLLQLQAAKADLLSSQLATLEAPQDAIVIDASQYLEVIVQFLINNIGNPGAGNLLPGNES